MPYTWDASCEACEAVISVMRHGKISVSHACAGEWPRRHHNNDCAQLCIVLQLPSYLKGVIREMSRRPHNNVHSSV